MIRPIFILSSVASYHVLLTPIKPRPLLPLSIQLASLFLEVSFDPNIVMVYIYQTISRIHIHISILSVYFSAMLKRKP